jgi:hypothetical protein
LPSPKVASNLIGVQPANDMKLAVMPDEYDPTVTLGSTTVGVTPYLQNLSLRLSRIAASSSDPKSASEIIRICNELVDKIEVLGKVFKVPERLK